MNINIILLIKKEKSGKKGARSDVIFKSLTSLKKIYAMRETLQKTRAQQLKTSVWHMFTSKNNGKQRSGMEKRFWSDVCIETQSWIIYMMKVMVVHTKKLLIIKKECKNAL